MYYFMRDKNQSLIEIGKYQNQTFAIVWFNIFLINEYRKTFQPERFDLIDENEMLCAYGTSAPITNIKLKRRWG